MQSPAVTSHLTGPECQPAAGEAVAAFTHSHPESGSGAQGYIRSGWGSGAKGFSRLSSCSNVYPKFSRQGCKEAALKYFSDVTKSKSISIELRHSTCSGQREGGLNIVPRWVYIPVKKAVPILPSNFFYSFHVSSLVWSWIPEELDHAHCALVLSWPCLKRARSPARLIAQGMLGLRVWQDFVSLISQGVPCTHVKPWSHLKCLRHLCGVMRKAGKNRTPSKRNLERFPNLLTLQSILNIVCQASTVCSTLSI